MCHLDVVANDRTNNPIHYHAWADKRLLEGVSVSFHDTGYYYADPQPWVPMVQSHFIDNRF